MYSCWLDSMTHLCSHKHSLSPFLWVMQGRKLLHAPDLITSTLCFTMNPLARIFSPVMVLFFSLGHLQVFYRNMLNRASVSFPWCLFFLWFQRSYWHLTSHTVSFNLRGVILQSLLFRQTQMEVILLLLHSHPFKAAFLWHYLSTFSTIL